MDTTTKVEELNQSSMNIILMAGNGRELYSNAAEEAEAGHFYEADELMQKAHIEITRAHQLQTKLIQAAVEEERPILTVLFIHAQDTLMSIDSEYRMTKRFLTLYKKLYELQQ